MSTSKLLFLRLSLLTLVSLSPAVQADPVSRVRQPLDLELYFAKAPIGEVKLSPAGDRVAYLLRKEPGVSVWTLDAETGAKTRHLASKVVRALHWSTDGRVLFLEAGETIAALPVEEKDGAVARASLIFRLDPVRRQELAMVDPVSPRHVLVSESAQSKNGGREEHRLLRVSAAGDVEVIYEGRQRLHSFLLDGEGRVSFITETDGRRLAVLDVRGEAPREVLSCGIEDACALRGTVDGGRRLYLTGRRGGDLWAFFSVDVVTGAVEVLHRDPEALADLDAIILDPVTGAPTVATYASDRVRSYGLARPIPRHLKRIEADLPGAELAVEPRAAGRFWLVTETGARQQFPRFHLYDAEKGSLRPILEEERRAALTLPEERLVDRRFFSYRATDGMLVHGRVSVPGDAPSPSSPMVVLVHGGPWNNSDPGFSAGAQFLADRSYVVFEPDFRASSGYGFTYMEAARGEFGDGKVLQDMIDGVDHLLAQGIGDRKRVAIMGHSFGGFATFAGLTFAADRFQAGIASAPPIDLVRTLNDVDDDTTVANGILQKPVIFDLLVDLEDDAALADLQARSPIAHLEKMDRPLLVFAGGQDEKVAIADVKGYVSSLAALGKDVSFLVDDRAGHGFDGPWLRKSLFALGERFLARHLGGAVGPSVDPELEAYAQSHLRVIGPSLGGSSDSEGSPHPGSEVTLGD